MTGRTQQVDEYLEALTPERRETLSAIREMIFTTVPEVNEMIAYGMPAYVLDDPNKILVSYSSRKQYISLYMDVSLVEQHKAELGGLDCGKSCIRFKHLNQLPMDVIATILCETVEQRQAA